METFKQNRNYHKSICLMGKNFDQWEIEIYKNKLVLKHEKKEIIFNGSEFIQLIDFIKTDI